MSLIVKLNGKPVEIQKGFLIRTILEQYPFERQRHILGAVVNHRLRGLYYKVASECEIQTVDYSTREGNGIYRRTLQLILSEAMSELFPKSKLRVGQSFSNSYFYEVENSHELTVEQIQKLKKKMIEIIAGNRRIRVESMESEAAETMFTDLGQPEKAALVNKLYVPEVTLVSVGRFVEMEHGPVADRTGVIEAFDVTPYENGFLLSFPLRDGKTLPTVRNRSKIFGVHREARRWGDLIGAWNVSHINEACVRGAIGELICISEGLHEKKIVEIADEIHRRGSQVKLVLIAGPSSSGKTTTTKRLATQLMVNGIKPVSLSVDNYYVDREKTPKLPDGSYDFESIDALDIKLFNEHLELLLKGEEVQAPVYNFVRGARDTHRTHPMRLLPGQILITEGIHCLNDALTPSVPVASKFRLYVSALTPLCIDRQNRIYTSDTRLVRRIVRDRLFRGYSASQTIMQWPKVREGEQKWIFPFQEEADVIFNSALLYESAVLKTYARRFLYEVPRNDPAYTEALRLLDFLRLFLPVFPEEVPPTSVLREFIGGSNFTQGG